MKNMIVILALGFLAKQASAAPCGPRTFTPDADVKLSTDTVLIVTHPSTQWDGRFSSKAGVDAAVEHAKSNKFQVVYLEDNLQANHNTYFFSDCSPDYWVSSYGGEFAFKVAPRRVISVGGHWEYCQNYSRASLMKEWANQTEDLTLTTVLDGTYTHGDQTVPADSYAKSLSWFLGVLSFRNPRSDWSESKLNMLELMGIINNEAAEIAHLKRLLPDYKSLKPNYRVEFYYKGKFVEVLQTGTGDRPPVFKIEYIDTLYKSGYAPSIRPRD